MNTRTRTLLGIALLIVGTVTAGLGMLGIVEAVVAVALPVAVLCPASGTVLVGTSDDSLERPV